MILCIRVGNVSAQDENYEHLYEALFPKSTEYSPTCAVRGSSLSNIYTRHSTLEHLSPASISPHCIHHHVTTP